MRALAVLACGVMALTAQQAPASASPPKHGRSARLAYVDGRSRGGHCSDRRSAASVRSPKKPWCSLARALRAARSGTTVLVRGGTYRPGVLARARPARLRLRAFPGERVELGQISVTAGRLRIEGFRMSGGINVGPGARRVAIVGNRTTNINIQAGARHILLAGNRIAQRASLRGINAINFNSTNSLPAIVAVTIRDNRIGPIPGGGDAIQAKHTRGLTIEHNEIFRVSRPPGSPAHPDAFQSIYGSRDLTIKDNFIHDIASQGIFLQTFHGVNRNFDAQDNVIARVAHPWTAFSANARGAAVAHNTVGGLLRAGGASVKVVANLATTNLMGDPKTGVSREAFNLAKRFTHAPGHGSLTGLPVFTNSRANDFRLRRNSPGWHAGPGDSDIGSRRADWSHPVFHP